MANYLSISDFAKKVGITRQTVYRKIEKDLSQFCVIQDGKRLISEEAVEIVLQEKQQNEAKCYNLDKHHTSTEDALKVTIKILQDQVKQKDMQIQNLLAVMIKNSEENNVKQIPKETGKNLFSKLWWNKK